MALVVETEKGVTGKPTPDAILSRVKEGKNAGRLYFYRFHTRDDGTVVRVFICWANLSNSHYIEKVEENDESVDKS